MLWHPKMRRMSRRRLGRRRTRHDRPVVTEPNTVGKNGNGTNRLAEKLNDSAWLPKLTPNSVTKTKKGIGNVGNVRT